MGRGARRRTGRRGRVRSHRRRAGRAGRSRRRVRRGGHRAVGQLGARGGRAGQGDRRLPRRLADTPDRPPLHPLPRAGALGRAAVPAGPSGRRLAGALGAGRAAGGPVRRRRGAMVRHGGGRGRDVRSVAGRRRNRRPGSRGAAGAPGCGLGPRAGCGRAARGPGPVGRHGGGPSRRDRGRRHHAGGRRVAGVGGGGRGRGAARPAGHRAADAPPPGPTLAERYGLTGPQQSGRAA
jgi:hypothetical protein